MLLPKQAPTNLRRLAVLAGALMTGACSAEVTSAPAPSTAINTPSMFVPTASQKALVGISDGTYVVTVDTRYNQSFGVGGNHLDIPAGAICDLTTSGYGPAFWDAPCKPAKGKIQLTIVIKNASSAHPSIDFFPSMRFNPTTNVELYMYAPRVSTDDAKNWQMFYCPGKGACYDESLTDPSLATKIDYTNNVLFRRVKHFSGYTVAE
jgi:hypothetical protein